MINKPYRPFDRTNMLPISFVYPSSVLHNLMWEIWIIIFESGCTKTEQNRQSDISNNRYNWLNIIAVTLKLHEHQHCMSINIAWTSTLHEHQHCMSINIAWTSTLHEHQHCMSINLAWTSTLHEHQHCMSINIAWASTGCFFIGTLIDL